MSQEIRTVSQIASGNQNWYTQILGESQDYFDLRQWAFADGGPFTDQDVRSANKVCVIGRTVAQQLFGSESPVGQIVRVKNVPFIILGVLIPKGLSVQGTDQDDTIIMPYSSAMKRVLGVTTLRAINVQAVDAAALPEAQKQITDVLRQRHHILPGRDDDFSVRNQQEIADASNAASETMRVLLGAIAGVSLVVGGIGIMNIMLVSVTERTREIGIRMAVGGRGRDILLQFLIEAITLSTFGGAIGIVVGLGTAKILSVVKGWATLTSPGSILVAFLFSAAVGIFFGFYPARKASRLDPIDALHYE
jgi:putative ABC transport system permease protein